MICDEDYDYIVDFMNKVVSFRLSNPDFEIPLWEMKSLVDSYANSFKNAKTKIRKP